MKNEIQLNKINFHFVVDGKDVIVNWLFLGRGFVQGREYASTYKVYVDYKEGSAFTTSLQANITNSKDLLNKSLMQDKVLTAKRELADCEDRIAKIGIAFGEGRVAKEDFDNAAKQINARQKQIMKEAHIL